MDQSLVPINKGELATSAGAATAVAEVQAAYAMAIRNPRNLFEARDRMLEACQREKFRGKARYRRVVGKDRYGKDVYAEGFSVHFARPAAVMYRNILINTGVLYEDDHVRKIVARATDIESNVAYTKEALIEKTVERKNSSGRDVISERKNSYGDTTYLVVAFPHEVDLKAAAMSAKLVRDCVLPLIPPDLLEEIEEKIIEYQSAEYVADPTTTRKKLVDAFKELGVSSKQLVAYLGHPIEELTPDEYANFKAMWTTIHDGQAKWSDYMESQRPEPTRASINLDDIKPGNPADHTDVGAPIGSQPDKTEAKSVSCLDMLNAFCDENELGESASEALFKACKKQFGKAPNLLPNSLFPDVEKWLNNARGGGAMIPGGDA